MHKPVTFAIRGLTSLLCQIEDAQLARVPPQGPLILAANHVNFLDAPLLYTHLQPRQVTGLAKAETWNNPIIGTLFTLWRGIPIRRGEADRQALRQAIQLLERGWIVAISPEGTRSGHGRLQRGHPGIVLLALHSGAPIQPVVYYGGENFKHNLARLHRTQVHIAVGRPFCVQIHEEKVTRLLRQQITDEIMLQLAALLPPEYRGVYAGIEAAPRYLKFV
jgi:1-acyl-sn-glycerol-3-phosphate acyltransferase